VVWRLQVYLVNPHLTGNLLTQTAFASQIQNI
jgi:hypothetical protein